MTNAEIPTGRQAARAWKHLDAGVRKDVWRRARQGLGHPDPAVAAIAVGRARRSLSRSVFVRYWGLIFVAFTCPLLALAAVLDRVTRLGPFYVLAITISFTSGALGCIRARREVEQMEEANMNTLRAAGHTDHGSPD
jgi:hypothetical protein